MPLGRKTKIESRWSAINKMVLEGLDDEQEFISQLLADPVLKALNHDMTVILGAIRSKAANNSGNVNAIQDPVTVPIPLNRYMGVLHFDTTTKGQKNGDVVYTYDHASAFRINAQAFRDRLDTLLKLREQENDLLDKHARPNPGMWVGYEKAA